MARKNRKKNSVVSGLIIGLCVLLILPVVSFIFKLGYKDYSLTCIDLMFNGDVSEVLPKTVVISDGKESFEMSVVWDTKDFDNQKEGKQKVFATFADKLNHQRFGIRYIYIYINVLPFDDSISSSENFEALNIEANNVSFGSDAPTYLFFAVSSETFNLIDYPVKMLFWDAPRETYLLGTEKYQSTAVDGIYTVNEKNCLLFYSESISPINYVDNIYVRAFVVVDGIAYYSEPYKASVLNWAVVYCAKDSVSEERKQAVASLLEEGADAQLADNYKTDMLATDIYFSLKLSNGVLEDGFSNGVYREGDIVNIIANPAEPGKKFSHWEDSNGVQISTESVCAVVIGQENVYYYAVYKDIGLE